MARRITRKEKMNEQQIRNVKNEVDTKLPKDGSEAMEGDMDMGGNDIINAANFGYYHFDFYQDAGTDVVGFYYFLSYAANNGDWHPNGYRNILYTNSDSTAYFWLINHSNYTNSLTIYGDFTNMGNGTVQTYEVGIKDGQGNWQTESITAIGGSVSSTITSYVPKEIAFFKITHEGSYHSSYCGCKEIRVYWE